MNAHTGSYLTRRKNAEGAAKREAARSLVGHQASTATKHGGDDWHFCAANF
jgi:hypothetical protein